MPPDTRIRHVDETLKLMSAITGDDMFEQSLNTLIRESGKEQVTMCDVVRNFVNQGRREGYANGREETRREYESMLADRDRALEEKERMISELRKQLEARNLI